MSSKAIQQNSTVFVTGVSGFIGAAVAQQLLEAGFKVLGATRSLTKADPLQKKFDSFGQGRFKLVEITDFAKPGAYDEALKDVSGVIHVAGDVSLSTDHDKVVQTTIDGIIQILKAAAKIPTIKRVVLTSSVVANFVGAKGANFKVDNAAFNNAIVNLSSTTTNDNPLKPFLVYAAGKSEGERAAWNWFDTEKPSFQLNTILPGFTIGEIINPNSDGSTSGHVRKLVLKGGDFPELQLFATIAPHFVDVKDTARLHVAALVEPDVQHERLFATALPYTLNEILAILRSLPNNSNIPNDLEGFGELTKIQLDNSRSTELLKRQGRPGWVSLKESLLETVKQ